MFGDEWPRRRRFPNTILGDGEAVEFGAVRFTVLDLGPGESPHDCIWFLGDDRRTVFLGDQCYDDMHAYLADGYYDQWLVHIERLAKELPADATLHIGHGGPVTPAHLSWQREYIETFLDAVRTADWSDFGAARAAVLERMAELLPADDLRFLMELSISPSPRSSGSRRQRERCSSASWASRSLRRRQTFA